MSQDWISSKYGVLVYGLSRSDRPAWVWSASGNATLWQNQAARWFEAPQKKGTPIPAGSARPIKGQVKRLLRLGFTGVPSLARVQMLVHEHPVSQTCRCTPIVLADGEPALLCVSADAVEVDASVRSASQVPAVDQLLPHLGAYAVVDQDDHILSASPDGITAARNDGFAQAQRENLSEGLSFLVFAEARPIPVPTATPPIVQLPEEPAQEEQTQETAVLPEPEELPAPGRLTELMERFDTDSNLYDPLGPEDDVLPDALSPPDAAPVEAIPPDEDDFGPDDDEIDPADVAELEIMDGVSKTEETAADDRADQVTEDEETSEPTRQWRVTGRGFVPETATDDAMIARDAGNEADDANADADADPAEAPDEEIDQAARYNFDELARILTDRVAGETPAFSAAEKTKPVERRSEARTLSLSDEHLVLNRLPLGILVFRDQDIVFANRAMADLLACASISELRERGLDAIFPRVGEPGVSPGPVATLLDSQGTQVPVSARLQAISWHGGPALMLSARREDTSPSGEVMVRNFVETLAATRSDGFVEINRAGVVEAASGRGAELLGRSAETLIGRPLAFFVAPEHIPDLRTFLEKPARRAGVDRPHLHIETSSGADMALFTEGSAGIVTGYFGLIADRSPSATPAPAGASSHSDEDPGLMAKMSRGLRRPLNTIIGFSQLLENQAFGPLGDAHYLEYSRDIQAAGREIEGLVDEIDQFNGLQNEAFVADASDFALDELLSECEGVVRHQAGRRQVFVRSAISEHLPFISADRRLMRQAVLNLLASAIDQTPQGGKVILSAQLDDDRSVSVHVRDSGTGQAELSERFAVFREGSARAGEAVVPIKSSIGLALTRSLLAVNSCKLTIDPSSGTGTVMSLQIPADVTRSQQRQAD